MTIRTVDLEHQRFEALGVRCEILIYGKGDLGETARRRLEQLDAAWSRYRSDSELSELNRCGELANVSDELLALVTCAANGWATTNGAFDPTTGRAVAPAGISGGGSRRLRIRGPKRWSREDSELGIRVDPVRRQVTLQRDVVFEAGALSRALAADMVVSDLRRQGACGAQVSIGDAMACAGHPPPGQTAWIATEFAPSRKHSDPAAVVLIEGGIASSSRLNRSSRQSRHRADAPKSRARQSNVESARPITVVVVDWSAADALIRAEAALASSIPEAMAGLASDGCPALAVDDEQQIWSTPQWSVLQQLATPTSP